MPLKVINFESKLKTYFTNGQMEDFGTDNRIAFLNDLVLYEIPTLHYESMRPDYIDPNDDRDTIEADSTNLPVYTRTTFKYYVIKKGEQKGIYFDTLGRKGKPFFIDSLIKNSNLSHENEPFYSQS